MKRAIVYVLFGDQSDPNSRVHKILRKVSKASQWKGSLGHPIVFVFGEENLTAVQSQGFEARLVDARPLVPHNSDPEIRCSTWIHKPLGWSAALQEFDELIALDWDIRPARRIELDNLFGRLGEKSFLQANLLQYRHVKALYRKQMIGSISNPAIRAIPSAAFVYLRGHDGQHAIERILHLMERFPSMTEEQAMARFVDELYGGWKGIENWWQHHEPYCCGMPQQREAVSTGGRTPREKEHLFLY